MLFCRREAFSFTRELMLGATQPGGCQRTVMCLLNRVIADRWGLALFGTARDEFATNLGFERESFYALSFRATGGENTFWPATGRQEGTLGEPVLSALQSRDRARTQVGCCIHVCPDRGSETAAKISSQANLFLPTVFSFSGDGASSGGRAQHCGVEDDSRTGRSRSIPEPGGLGESARNCWSAASQ
jgi:hypothetical protein